MGLLSTVRRIGPMDGEVRHHALAHELVVHKAPNQRDLLVEGQFARKGDFDLAGELRIDPLFRPLDHVPERLPIRDPGWGFHAFGNHDLREHHIGLVELEPLALGSVKKALA